jgi:CRP-like cAMP-binding protein
VISEALKEMWDEIETSLSSVMRASPLQIKPTGADPTSVVLLALTRNPWLRHLPTRMLRSLAAALFEHGRVMSRSAADRWTVVQQGQPFTCFHIVLSGHIVLERPPTGGASESIGRGGYFGEGILVQRKDLATAEHTATADVVLLEADAQASQDAFLQVVKAQQRERILQQLSAARRSEMSSTEICHALVRNKRLATLDIGYIKKLAALAKPVVFYDGE